MKDQSQIEDMRAAVRGDIERAKRRRNGSPELPAEREPQRVREEEPQQKSGLLTFFRKR